MVGRGVMHCQTCTDLAPVLTWTCPASWSRSWTYSTTPQSPSRSQSWSWTRPRVHRRATFSWLERGKQWREGSGAPRSGENDSPVRHPSRPNSQVNRSHCATVGCVTPESCVCTTWRRVNPLLLRDVLQRFEDMAVCEHVIVFRSHSSHGGGGSDSMRRPSNIWMKRHSLRAVVLKLGWGGSWRHSKWWVISFKYI